MKILLSCLTLLLCLSISGCFGYASKGNELIGQVKKIKSVTPLLCPDRTEVDVSLGVMRNGVGSMSSEDLWLNVTNSKDLETLKKAQEAAQVVKINYDSHRGVFCWNSTAEVKSVEVVK